MRKVGRKSKINFTKMQSLGNDFIILDLFKNNIKVSKKLIRDLSSRQYGVGCDQVLIISKSKDKKIHFNYRIFNSDGSEASQCGNGAKCVGKFFFDRYKPSTKKIYAKTSSSLIEIERTTSDVYEINMGIPLLNEDKVSSMCSYKGRNKIFKFNRRNYNFHIAYIGNPHAIFFMNSIDSFDLESFSTSFNKKNFFKHGVNISFVKRNSKSNISLRVFERGVGETLSCGSAACASVITLNNIYLTSTNVSVNMLGGTARVKWDGKENSSLYLTGKASNIFDGEYYL
tara:strand:+ start:3417 stop:4271 length:855 start_codon:yes stop_codon:yes gene_type:complete